MAISNGNFTYIVDKDYVTRSYKGEIVTTKHKKVEIEKDINLLEKSEKNSDGFLVSSFLEKDQFLKLQSSVFKFLSRSFNLDLNKQNITDKLSKIDDKNFKDKMKKLYYGIPFEELNFSKSQIEERVSRLVKLNLICDDLPSKSDGTYVGPPGPESVQIRIVRPNKPEFNPPHRDIYYDNLRNALNCFMPIYGVNNKSSLPIIIGSHLWPEDETIRTEKYPIVDGTKFSVPAIISRKDGSIIRMKRPKVDYGNLMLFSPYSIHGGGVNLGKQVRISFELRFWKI
tara:strand:- start:67 stop:918 length:852 start_codon:yes stop_codon:yes gene_type:complete